ncbi:hypothetical protein D9758_016579 [Tetrapyrgos nigripes]|uniref:Uncharacterized protein n=1 Tax=Tetrapyrgos nigripes TaxID=182062 RepID=A0A8H5C2G5_9AGAR|nr:hypothetical protein D9758_016579 [Tetrapyrgos nigripes]
MAALVEQRSLQKPQLPHSHLEFTLSPDRTQYIRRAHGRERSSACTSQYSDGNMHQYGIGILEFKESVSQPEMFKHARAAWMKLRFQAPWMAYRCSSIKDDPEPNAFLLSYDIIGRNSKMTQNGFQNLEEWADDTLMMRDEVRTFDEWEMWLKDHFWRPSEGHFGMESHIAWGADDKHWIVMSSAPHMTADARGVFSLFDLYMKLVTKEFQDSKKATYVPPERYPWGDEISKLTPAATTLLPDVGTEPVLNPDPSKLVQFDRQPFPSTVVPISTDTTSLYGDSLLNKIALSQTDTRAITLACSKAKCTLTVLLNSILLLADVEKAVGMLLAEAKKQNSPKMMALVEENWYKAEVWCIQINPVDMRGYVYPRYQTLHGSSTSGGILNVMVPTYHSMTAIRKCLTIKDGKIHRTWYSNPSAFWVDVIQDTQALLKIVAKTPPSLFHKSAVMSEQFAPLMGTVSADAMMGTKPLGMIPSSIGSMERLGLYRDFSPLYQKSKMGTDAEPPYLIPQMAVGGRSHNTPAVTVTIWEYNGSMVMNTQGSKRHQNAEGWDMFCSAAIDGFKQVIKGVLASQRSEGARAAL